MKSNSLLNFLVEENSQNTGRALEDYNWITILFKYILFIATLFLSALISLYSLISSMQEIHSNQNQKKTMAEQSFINRLYQAIERQDISSISNMLKNSEVNLNKVSYPFKETCLELAVRIGNTEIVQILLDSGANIDANNSEHDTLPITIAIASGNFKMIKFLVKSGANIQKKSKFYESLNHENSTVYLTQFEYAQHRYGEDDSKNHANMLDSMNSLGASTKVAKSSQTRIKA